MRAHLYEFRSDKRKLKCLCGWERTLKSVDSKTISAAFAEHCKEKALKPS